ncbi:MAG: hypothetical protein BGO38_12565 [Cellulomonas sp. 73-145]|uniref:hypothetical protein n=1 Tax=Cellulomonas sp. 73-145 TaxID=1895739 RepID=UPI00092AC951|nr:hypothetical protein [Cellulomonas sp. 73-145]OJV59632.1 MAG: hypothetical protein BGO38_12565 [Cellulomonas sp. 73-145]
MQLINGPGTHTVAARDYVLQVRSAPPEAILAEPDGRIWARLSLLASVDRVDVPDESVDVGAPVVRTLADDGATPTHDGFVVEVRLTTDSTAWDHRTTVLRCFEDRVEVTVHVEGQGRVSTVRLLGGRAALRSGACGSFRSGIEFASVYVPTPTEPVDVVRPAHAPATLGVLGDALPGRLHGVFSPPPLCLALGRSLADGATDVPAGPWLSLAVLAPVSALRFTELRYQPSDGGFHLELDYDGHTVVQQELTTPTLVLRPVPDPWSALARYRDDLVSRDFAPVAGPAPADWWAEPIFCGWGAQCARAPLPGDPLTHPLFLADLPSAVVPDGLPVAADLARQDVYDELLDHLAAHDVVPGTVVVDDRWQAAYGSAEPDPQRWPDLRGWIRARHERHQRVLLWWKAWDADGLPADWCVRDVTGHAVAADPGNPAYLEGVRRIVGRLLGPDGLDADGFKVDFTQRSPAGTGLVPHREPDGGATTWGVAGLHALLEALYRAAKEVKPDALVVTHTPHPSFGDVCDMVRLNDVLERDVAGRPVPVADQLRFRHAVATASLPHHLVDTDQWPMPDRAQWRSYVAAQAALGVPALYYAERIDRTQEPLRDDDLALVAATWRTYRAQRTALVGSQPAGVP